MSTSTVVLKILRLWNSARYAVLLTAISFARHYLSLVKSWFEKPKKKAPKRMKPVTPATV